MALTALLWPSVGRAALPPAEEVSAQNRNAEPAEKPVLAVGGTIADGENRPENTWAIPPVRFGGTVSYELRRDVTEEQSRMQQGMTTTLNASTQTFIWQPWFAQLAGNLGVTLSRFGSSSDTTEASSSSNSSVFLTGSGQLSILPQSRFPFEAHYDRSDSRVSNELAIGNDFASQRYGFSQHYMHQQGDSMIGWDRNTQNSARSGRDQQDNWQLSSSHSLESQRAQLLGNRTRNTRENTGESAVQNNLSLQHSYTPNPTLSVESMSNISRSGYHLEQGDNNTRITQLSSQAFWRPVDKPLTVTGGARVFALEADTSGLAIDSSFAGARVSNANVNAGVNYELSKFTRLNAGANVNLITNNGVRSNNTNQTVGATYQPDFRELGKFRYIWSASGSFVNSTGSEDASRQGTLQLSHGLSRSVIFNPGSIISMELAQSVTALASTGTSNNSASNGSTLNNDAGSTARLTHSGSLSWNLSKEAGEALVRLSASDSRTVGGRQEFFQLVNLQASSNLPTGEYSSWTGNLTVQGVRQDAAIIGNTAAFGISDQNANEEHGFVTTSNASLTYQQQRVFGVRRLRFVSDLRLNSQALLPLLGGPQDQETAAWENRLDYAIGRTQLRLNLLISRNTTQRTSTEKVESINNLNKSIFFSVIRSF